MTRPKRPGDLQLAILRVLWDCGSARVAEVHGALLPQRPLALTTIATMLRKMESRGLVRHHLDGRQFVYEATVEEGEVKRGMVTDVVDRAFAGDASAVVNHLLRETEFDAVELAELRQMIASKEAELGGQRRG